MKNRVLIKWCNNCCEELMLLLFNGVVSTIKQLCKL